MSKPLGLWSRVKMAPELARQFGAAGNRRREKGTIAGESRDKQCWRVDWDRLSAPESINKLLLLPLDRNAR